VNWTNWFVIVTVCKLCKCMEFKCDSVGVKPSWAMSEIGESLICVRVIPNWLWQNQVGCMHVCE
jgi:hypothetical protein